jgi:hypothetical protein
VFLTGSDATENLVQGNYIGTDATGTSSVFFGRGDGVFLTDARSNTIGGTAAGAGNVISGNQSGITLTQAAADNLFQGNYIGTTADGLSDLGNRDHGVRIARDASGNIIGGTTAAARNIISGNGLHGVRIRPVDVQVPTNNSIQGNYIGTDVTGTAIIANDGDGVFIEDSPSNTVGGTTGAGNVISGNTNGVKITGTGATGNLVRGNLIGTDAGGTADLGNGNDGVLLEDAADNLVGGWLSSEANTIAFNGRNGVSVTSGSGNAILYNAIFSNTGLGIDLGADGVTPNDANDSDVGPNNLQNFPVLDLAYQGSTVIDGSVTGAPSTDYALQFFSSNTCDVSGHGQAASFLDSTTVTTDAAGQAGFTFTASTTLSIDAAVTATATDPDNNTSELSACAAVTDVAIAADPGNVTVERGEDATYTVTLTPSGTFDAPIALACSGLPAEASCAFAPGTVTPGGTAETSTLTVSTTPSITTGLIDFTVTGTSGSLSRSTNLMVIAVDFVIAPSPTDVVVPRGEDATYEVTASLVGGGTFPGPVSFACTGLPALSSCTFAPNPVTPGVDPVMSTLTVATTDPDTPTGAAAFTVTATSGALESMAMVTMTVTDFTVAGSPASVSVVRGEDAGYTVTVSPDGGSFADPVTLSCTDLPVGTTCAFGQNPVTPAANDATSSLAVSTTGPDTPTGDATFTIVGTSGALTSETTLDLEVTKDFTIAVLPENATVTAGQSASFTVTIGQIGFFDDEVTISCSGLPTGASCSFSPASVTPGGSDATSTMTVSTAATSMAAFGQRTNPVSSPFEVVWSLGLLLGVVGIAVACGTARGRNRVLGLAFAAALSMTYVACGGDPTEPPPPAPTVTTFTVTGQAGATQHAATATLTVRP